MTTEYTAKTEYTAEIIRIDDPRYDSECERVYMDTVAVYRGGVRVALVDVESSKFPAGYDDAIARAIGSHDFVWVY